MFVTFAHVLPILLYLGAALAAELEPLWTIKDGDVSVGGCKDFSTPLKQSYEEALELAQKGVDALTSLQHPRPAPNSDPLSWADPEADTAEWNRRARVAKALFAINAEPQTGVVAGPSDDRLKFAKGMYKIALQYTEWTMLTCVVAASFEAIVRNANQARSDTTKCRVYCSPNGFAYFGPGSKTPDGVTVDAGEDPYGLFILPAILPDWPGHEVFQLDQGQSTDPYDLICSGDGVVYGDTFAVTLSGYKTLMFCPYGIQAPSVLGNGDTIKENDGLPRRTLSTIWLHELMHLWTITIPGRTTDVGDQGAAEGEVDSATQSQERQAYGFAEAAQLARLLPGKAGDNADTYALFAAAIWLNEWDFGTPEKPGQASPFERQSS